VDAVNYIGATESELRQLTGARRLPGLADQRTLFPHQGILRLEPDALVLGGWQRVPRTRIRQAEVTFTSAYTRFTAGGIRGNASSLGLFGSLGKPVVLIIEDDEPIYLLLEYRWSLGTNQARRLAPEIQRWLARRTSENR
jgi:hypothetical protein